MILQVRFPRVRFLGWDFYCDFPEKYSKFIPSNDSQVLGVFYLILAAILVVSSITRTRYNSLLSSFYSNPCYPVFLFVRRRTLSIVRTAETVEEEDTKRRIIQAGAFT